MPLPFFSSDLVSDVLYINSSSHAPQRDTAFRKMADALNISVEKVEATYGSDFPKDVQHDIISRTKAKRRDASGRGWKDTLETNELPRGKFDEIDDSIINNALGKYGCLSSHIQAMERALERCAPEDNRWIVILEDDANIPANTREKIDDALRNAPDDAGAIMRAYSGHGAVHFL